MDLSFLKAEQVIRGANCRSVWEIATQPYAEAHFERVHKHSLSFAAETERAEA